MEDKWSLGKKHASHARAQSHAEQIQLYRAWLTFDPLVKEPYFFLCYVWYCYYKQKNQLEGKYYHLQTLCSKILIIALNLFWPQE